MDRDGGPWLSLLIDIDAPIDAIDTRGASHLYVTVTKGRQPVGQTIVPCWLDPLPGHVLLDEIRFRLRHEFLRHVVAAVGAPPQRDSPERDAAVVVCTKDRGESLARCLRSIRQSSASSLDLVVVENGPSTELVRDLVEMYEAKYVVEPVPGLDRARNRGLAETDREIVLFTDDDVEVDEDWARLLLGCFADPLVVAATGLVLPAALETPAQRQSELFASHGRGTRRRVFDGGSTSPAAAGAAGVGASMAFRRSFMTRIGGFPEELDAGMPTGTGGDTYALYRALRAGYQVTYEPAAIVRHWHRRSDDELTRAFAANGRGITAYLSHLLWADRDPSSITQVLPAAARYLLKRALRLENGPHGLPPTRLVRAELKGAVSGPLGYARSHAQVRKWGRIDVDGGAKGDTRVGHDAGGPEEGQEDLPRMSVIIPTRGRRESVLGLLRDLETQDYPSRMVDTIVVLDGDIDGTREAIRTAGLSIPVHILSTGATEASGHGPAAARNLGAADAKGEILVFLDDDVTPIGTTFLRRHAEGHTGNDCAVAGPCHVGLESANGFFPQRVRNWWVDHTERMNRLVEPDFTDLCTGNFSIRAATFARLGGFADLARREDWEFSYRLAQNHVPLLLAPDAGVLQTPEIDVLESLKDRRGEGIGDAAFVELHPEVLTWLPLGGWLEMGRRRTVVKALFRRPELFHILRPLSVLLAALERCGLRRQWSRLLDNMNFLAYWSGVASRLGNEATWLGLVEAARAKSPDPVPIEIEGDHDSRPPTGSAFAFMVTCGSVPLGVVTPVLGGLPWTTTRFLNAVKGRFFDEIVQLEVERARS